jgi:hypothetical protein
MSHITTIKSVGIRDEAAIVAAVDALRARGVKVSLKRDQKPRMYFNGTSPKCEYVLHCEGGNYDVGLQKQKDGTFAPVFDEHGRYVGNVLGASGGIPTKDEDRAQHQIGQFLQAYSVEAAKNAATAQGYIVEGTEIDADGNVHLTIGVH